MNIKAQAERILELSVPPDMSGTAPIDYYALAAKAGTETLQYAPQVAKALLRAIETLNKIATHLDGVKSECYASQYTINDDDMEAVYFCRDTAQEFLKNVGGGTI